MTDFLKSLTDAGTCPPIATNTAQRFMRTKGYPDTAPLGVYIDNNQLLYYYYRLPQGVLEIELKNEVDGTWHRRVTDFITREADVKDMLGETATTDESPESPSA